MKFLKRQEHQNILLKMLVVTYFSQYFSKKLSIYNKFHTKYSLNTRMHRVFKSDGCSFYVQIEVKKEARPHSKEHFPLFFCLFPSLLSVFRSLIYFYRYIIDIFRFLSITIEFYRLLSDFVVSFSISSITMYLLIFYNYSRPLKQARQQSRISLSSILLSIFL